MSNSARVRSRTIVVVAACLFSGLWFTPTASAQMLWQLVQPSSRPKPTVDSQAVFDSRRGVVVAFGGVESLSSLVHNNETWEYDGLAWKRVLTQNAPSPRRAHAMAFDSDRGITVLFGGYEQSSGRLSDTWEYDGTNWRRVVTPTVPPANWQLAMAYDPLRQVIVAFGGFLYGPTSAQTWEYDGSDWRMRSLPLSPAARKGHAMTWCPTRGAVVMYGGATQGSIHGDLADTWQYDGVTWTLLQSVSAPGARGGHELVTLNTGDLLAFGGRVGTGGSFLDDTWRFRDGVWERLFSPTNPAARDLFVMAYDSARDRVVLYTGRISNYDIASDMWELGSPECGNGVVDPGEQCDDGNTRNGDGCQADCTLCAPSPEQCNGLDDDCDLVVSEAERDLDVDGYLGCAECDDRNATIYPSATQLCDGVNNDCSDPGWPALPPTEQDIDADGFAVCEGDCDDSDTSSFPGAPERLDGRDNDCDGTIDEGFAGQWDRVTPATSPRPRVAAASAFDSTRGLMVLFGGLLDLTIRPDDPRLMTPTAGRWHVVENPGLSSDETWLYDGKSWRLLEVARRPAARHSAAAAFDAIRSRVVLFGGWVKGTGAASGETWEFDGTDWSLAPLASSPPPATGASMAYDPVRQVVVMFGGLVGDTPVSDTWEYNGAGWMRRSPAASPPPRHGAAMFFDAESGVMTLHGGSAAADGSAVLNDTWTYDGNGWSIVTADPRPVARTAAAAVAFEFGGGGLLFGGAAAGNPPSAYLGDTWRRTNGAWLLQGLASAPPPRVLAAAAYDSQRGVAVVFGGFDGQRGLSDTWEYRVPHCGDGHVDENETCDDGNRVNGDGCSTLCVPDAPTRREWRRLSPVHRPAPRVSSDAVYDSIRDRIVLFGGFDEYQHLGDTWEFDGADWHPITTVHLPAPRRSHEMAFDSNRGLVVMYGGYSSASGQMSDTWEYDGQDWIKRTPAASPPLMWQHEMEYDASRGVVVLFGSSGPFRNETWEYDGTTWRKINTPRAPSPRAQVCMAYDAVQARIFLFGGYDGNNYADTWTYDGTSWTQLAPATVPVSRRAHECVFDASRNEIVMFGGSNRDNLPTAYYNDTQVFTQADWSELEFDVVPPPRHHFTMVYDSARGRVVMAMGRNPGLLNDTWVLDSPLPVQLQGNGRIDIGEECDDGNRLDGDGCQKNGLRCTPRREVFNGMDDDCDGLYDENVAVGDRDGDGIGDAADADDGEVQFTYFSHPLITWQSEPHAIDYNVYRGSVEVLRTTLAYTQPIGSSHAAEQFGHIQGIALEDSFVPNPGEGAFWLVTMNDALGESTLGTGFCGIRRNLNPVP